MRQNEFLVFFDEKTSESVLKIMKKFSEKFDGIVNLVYVKDIDYYPVEVLLEAEKSYDSLKKFGLKLAEDLAKKIRKLGFKQVHIDFCMGHRSEIEYMKNKNPDFIIDLRHS
ncbi:adenine nucleotide alpha hydrolase family protein [Archaeoglobus profundus]|uniref:UspA domain-containing protein n=1 Tax=Archaeoglobus profundus (strain DSM 5631 / JCM 9629 / NBRC 100127 / Av18) TaxID=572546 RepID=D2RFF3_ARCPA|nr:hypothetical protein [Archaeoglobus profundus]ADB58847.1 hypothetical protein Arcpr_1803 [Archaeoglobus profundus DSM 5631]